MSDKQKQIDPDLYRRLKEAVLRAGENTTYGKTVWKGR